MLNLERIPELLAVVIDKLEYLFVRMVDLNGVGLHMNDLVSTLLDFQHQINHEQSAAFGNPVVDVSRIV